LTRPGNGVGWSRLPLKTFSCSSVNGVETRRAFFITLRRRKHFAREKGPTILKGLQWGLQKNYCQNFCSTLEKSWYADLTNLSSRHKRFGEGIDLPRPEGLLFHGIGKGRSNGPGGRLQVEGGMIDVTRAWPRGYKDRDLMLHSPRRGIA